MRRDLPIVYIIDASQAVTGAFVAARNMAQAMRESWRMVLVLPEGSTIPTSELSDFWRVEYLPIVSLSKNKSAMLRYVPALLCASWRLRKLMQKDAAEKLLLNDFYLMHGAVLRVLGYRGRILQWVRCNPYNYAGKIAQPLLWLARKSADNFIAVSSFVQSLLPRHYNTEILYDYYAGKPRTTTQPTEKTFIYVGNYIVGKGQDVAVQAFAKIAQHDATLRLAFYGGDMGLQKNRDYKTQLEVAAKQTGLSDRMTFHDFVADTFPILESAFATLNFSVSESFSMTVLEASGAGVPVIATASGGPQEIIKDGITGYSIPVGDVDMAADKMLELLRNPEQAAMMGRAGAEHIKQRFSAEVFRSKLQKL